MINESYIKSIFPELSWIKSKPLRKKVISLWLIAIKRSGWQKINDIPFTLLIPTKTSLIEHTRKVTQLALKISELRQDLKKDILIAGALTHDVGKLFEYESKDGSVVKSASKVRHPVSGYQLAIEVGLPHEVAHIIIAHSHEGDKIERSNEAIVVHHCDFIDFELEKNYVNL
ncbi:MAG: HD domain-containing protein [bacterium]|nr:HD domain-containing protein [bacterium]